MAQASSPSFQERFANAGTQLTPTERKIAEFLIRHPDDVIDASALQIANACGTSDATVIRAVQTLGYSGLRELKREFLQDVLRRRSLSASLDHTLDQVLASDSPVSRVLADSVSVLETFRQEFDHAIVDRAAKTLAGAQRIYAYGLGPGGLVAAFFSLHLNRFGFDAQAMAQTGYRLADELLPIRNGDSVALFAPYHQTAEVEAIVDHSKAVGASVILITEALGVSLKDRVDVVIRTPATVSSLASEMLVPQALSIALAMQMAAQDRKAAVDRGRLFNRLASRFTGSLEMPSPPFLHEYEIDD
jgi:DNA-binding MurR/RpiR family transcriptional regulator